MSFMKRILGLVMVLIGISGLGVSFFGARLGHEVVDSIASNLDSTLLLVTQSMENVSATLILAKSTVGDVNVAMTTVEETTDNLAQTVRLTKPLMEQINTVASEEVPDSLEAIETAFPSLEQVAGVIDSTLAALNAFRIEEDILGFEINYDLGVDYAPEVPFDESVANLAESLDGLPESLRSLKIYLNVTTDNLDTISRDIFTLADDIGTLNERISELDPILDEYLLIISQINDDTRALRSLIRENVSTVKMGITVLSIWFGLTQVAPLYLGIELLSGQRNSNNQQEETESDEATES